MSDNNYSAISQYTGCKSKPVTPSDTTVIAASSLYVTTGGTVIMVFDDDSEDTWTVPSFFIIPLAVKKVKAASTATGIKAIY
jgi:hypothetical protein